MMTKVNMLSLVAPFALAVVGGTGNPEYVKDMTELNLARALLACGDHEGLARKTLEKYAADGRGVFAQNARAILQGR